MTIESFMVWLHLRVLNRQFRDSEQDSFVETLEDNLIGFLKEKHEHTAYTADKLVDSFRQEAINITFGKVGKKGKM